jgi:sarcosine oxidase delta subunit
MMMLLCPCSQECRIWAEFWWVGRGHQWVFFDDQTSETHAEEVTHCPGCGRLLDRKTLKAASPFISRY